MNLSLQQLWLEIICVEGNYFIKLLRVVLVVGSMNKGLFRVSVHTVARLVEAVLDHRDGKIYCLKVLAGIQVFYRLMLVPNSSANFNAGMSLSLPWKSGFISAYGFSVQVHPCKEQVESLI